MYLYEPIYKNGIIDRINRICGTTNESFYITEKVAFINDALDSYFELASMAAPRGTFDDSGITGAPVETQSLVDGTNAYKITSFTNNVLKINKVSVLDDDAAEYDLKYEEFDSVDDFLETYSTDTDDKGKPEYWTRFGDYIYIAPTPNYSETDGLRCYASRELVKFTPVTLTITEANPGVGTTSAVHGMVDGDVIVLSTDGTLPTNLTADTTAYYIDQQNTTTFKFCTTPSNVGSTYVNTTGSVQAGAHKYLQVNKEPGIPLIHHQYLVYFASDKFMDPTNAKFARNRADLEKAEKRITEYWQSNVQSAKTRIGTGYRAYK